MCPKYSLTFIYIQYIILYDMMVFNVKKKICVIFKSKSITQGLALVIWVLRMIYRGTMSSFGFVTNAMSSASET